MKPFPRRVFLKHSLLGAGAVSLPKPVALASRDSITAPRAPAARPLGIIDTNVNLFEWPFRALKYRDTKTLVTKLRNHQVIEAWAGSFEALFAKDINGVNTRLAEECRTQAPGFLIPFGTVNLAWPDWEEDLRRCHEIHKMPGIRIYPGYQPFDLDHPSIEQLVAKTSQRGLILQIVFGMEDPRVHHPILSVGPVTFAPLLKAMENTPAARVQLLHFAGSPQNKEIAQFMTHPNTFLEISRLEGNGAIARMLGSINGWPAANVPVDRITFGSHAPYFPIETAILKLIESPLSLPQIHAILQSNARRFRAFRDGKL